MSKPSTAITGDIIASHPDLGERGFSKEQWAALKDEKDQRQGWQEKPNKPAELK